VCGGEIDPSLTPWSREPHEGHPLAGTADHVVPLAEGGTDTDENLRAAHWTCNTRRGRHTRLGLPSGVRPAIEARR